jgi:hypothetical protein
MFEWLEQEISSIKTPRFHLIDGPADSKLREAIIQSALPVPDSYREFVLRFGNAKLYRRARNDSYRIGVFAGPRQARLEDGTLLHHLGFRDGASIYVKPTNTAKLPIFSFEDGCEEMAAENFEDWLTNNCAEVRKRYSKNEWAAIMRGPDPFKEEEKRIIETRRLIRWRVAGIDSDGNHIFEVSNMGQLTLPALTLGVRSKDRRLNGAVYLKIGHVAPGQSTIVHADCYKNLVPPSEIEIFSLSDPKPEDREYFFELRRA